jgi:PAS domain-containing protein
LPGKFLADSYTDHERHSLLVNTIRDYAIYMLDREGRVSSWNAGAQRFKGYLSNEIIGEHFSRFYTPEEQAAGVPALALETSARTGIFETEGWRAPCLFGRSNDHSSKNHRLRKQSGRGRLLKVFSLHQDKECRSISALCLKLTPVCLRECSFPCGPPPRCR